MRKMLPILLSFIITSSSLAAGTDFSDKNKAIIYTHSLDIIREYQRLINEMGEFAITSPEAAQSSSESFLELFVNRQVLVFNDLDPSYNLSAFYEAETYVSNLMLWYPDGMKINLDFQNAKVGNIIQHEDEIFSLDIMLTKKIDGNYLNRSQNQNTEEILFRVAFNTRGSGYSNYKIVGIRNSDATNIPDFNKNLEEVNSEEMDENDLFKVAEGMRAVMQDYINFIALLGDPEELEEDKEFYRESFKVLFENEDVKVYNDLTPEPLKSLLSTNEYLQSLASDYPKGISNVFIPLDSAKIGKAIKAEEGYYYATLKSNKFFSGNYQEKQGFRKTFPLNVKIRFEKTGNAFTNFKIQSIDIEADDFYQSDENAEESSLPSLAITTITRKGWSVGIEASYGLSYYENQTINSLVQDYDFNTWTSTPGYGIKAAMNAYYFINDNMGIKTGISFNTYENNFSLNGEFQDIKLSKDINNADFYKRINAEFDSAISISNLSLPLVLNYTSGKPGNIGFYTEAGLLLSYNLSATYHSTGDYQSYGYYPFSTVPLDYKYEGQDIFYNHENINEKGDLLISGFNITGYGSLGINISMGYFSSLKIGPEIYYGISDLDSGSTYTDLFGKEIPRQITRIKKYSLKVSYLLKL
jgi:hypothetical protein